MAQKQKKVREIALETLETIDKQQSYSNLLLNQVITKHRVQGPDVGLLTELVYGTIQRKLTLDFYLSPFLKKKPDSWVLNLLRLSLYQLVFLDKIPDRAVLFEAVEIAKTRGHKGIASFVNATLREIQRKGVPSIQSIKDPLERVSIETSHPFWLVKRWNEQYGFDKMKAMCEANNIAPIQTARVNIVKISREEAVDKLRDEGFEVEPSPLIQESIRVLRGNVAHSQAYSQGLISIQDESSMMVAYALQLSEQQRVLDACAAPGGKTGHIAEKLNNQGEVIALDLHPHKIKLIQENSDRLGLINVKAMVMDSRKASEFFTKGYFDRILIDAPCSGLGVLKRKPDIKYTKTENDIYSLQHVQLSILNEAAKLLKKGGLLVFSTCTVDKVENEETVRQFLEENHHFVPYNLVLPSELSLLNKEKEHFIQILPQDFGGDGFFISCLKKQEN